MNRSFSFDHVGSRVEIGLQRITRDGYGMSGKGSIFIEGWAERWNGIDGRRGDGRRFAVMFFQMGRRGNGWGSKKESQYGERSDGK